MNRCDGLNNAIDLMVEEFTLRHPDSTSIDNVFDPRYAVTYGFLMGLLMNADKETREAVLQLFHDKLGYTHEEIATEIIGA